MKTKAAKSLLASICALALAVSTGTTLSVAKVNKSPEIVLAQSEETPDTDEENSFLDENATPSQNENSNEAQESESESETTEKEQLPAIEPKEIVKLILKGFKDAIKDLLEHFKRWLKLS